MKLCLLLLIAALLAGCALKGQFVNEVSCDDESKRMTFTSWWFEWLGISARVANGAQHCGAQPVILQVIPGPKAGI